MDIAIPDSQPVYHPSFFQTNLKEHGSKIKITDMEEYKIYRNDLVDGKPREDQDMTYLEHYKTPYKGILGTTQELSSFSKLFFSKENLSWVQKNIRYLVYNISNKYIISEQDETNLLIVMKAIYLQNSRNPDKSSMYKKEILRLNGLVLNEVVPDILSKIQQYRGYLSDISKIQEPISLPVNMSITGTKSNRGPSDVLGINTL